jgi:putative endonuclease
MDETYHVERGVWVVYVIQSLVTRTSKTGRVLPGFFYVGMTNDLTRRLRQHNGEITGGGKYTAKHRPWRLEAAYGPYADRSEALKAEYALKHSKRGIRRVYWQPEESPWCRRFWRSSRYTGRAT